MVLYLVVRKLAVLQVGSAAEGPDAGIGVVVGVFAHTVWETLLKKKIENHFCLKPFRNYTPTPIYQ